jgi:uncharacterized membrane protein
VRARFSTFLDRIRSSYWFVPAVMSLMAVGLSTLMLYLDRRYADRIPSDAWWLYGGGDEGARVVLSAIVTSMISVTSVVFSITIVALTLAAGQFGSRVLRNFMRDRGNQITLGTFIATFVYAMLVLRSVRGLDDAGFVPPLAMSTGHPPRFRERGGPDLLHPPRGKFDPGGQRRAFHRGRDRGCHRAALPRFHRRGSAGARWQGNGRAGEAGRFRSRFDAEAKRGTCSRGSDQLQIIDHDGLMELAVEHDLVIRLRARPGDFVVHDGLIAEIWKEGDLDSGTSER